MNQVTCPICARRLEGPMSDWPYLPFCSLRCKKIDLGRWLDDTYSIPVAEPEEEDLYDAPEDP